MRRKVSQAEVESNDEEGNTPDSRQNMTIMENVIWGYEREIKDASFRGNKIP